MESKDRKKIYEELRDFTDGVKNVAKELGFSENYVRNVMTRLENCKSAPQITEACIKEIMKRREEQDRRLATYIKSDTRLAKIFALAYANKLS